MIDKEKSAFTLAEVLITLVIIGVVAALTIPTAINNYRKHEYYSAFKKTYSTFLQATNKIISEHGIPNASVGGWATTTANVRNMYKKYLSSQDCTVSNNCFTQYQIRGPKYLSGDNYSDAQFWNSYYSGFVLSDGTQVTIAQFSASCAYHNKRCFEFWTDLNGQKGPNQWGRDVFVYAVTDNGLEYNFPTNDCVPNGTNKVGYGCAAKLLQENAMNY